MYRTGGRTLWYRKIRGGETLLMIGIGTQGLIFVIDSSDRARIDEARQELHRIISDREMKESLLLVFANKQDVAGGMCTHRFSLSSRKTDANNFDSYETPRSDRGSQALPTERQDLVRGTELCCHR